MTDAPLSEILLESMEKYYWPTLRNTAVRDGRKKRDQPTNQPTDKQGVSRSRMLGLFHSLSLSLSLSLSAKVLSEKIILISLHCLIFK